MTRLPHAITLATLYALPLNAQEAATPDAVSQIAPQLGRYTQDVLADRLWADQDRLKTRDRSLLTVSALVAMGRADQLDRYIATALDSGVTPEELSELVTHLAFYAGWPVALPALDQIAAALTNRGIDADVSLDPELLPYDSEAEAARLATVDQTARPVSPGLADATDQVLFADLWRRPGLAPRDRSLVTVAALIANGQAEQLPFHLNRAMDNGLTFEEAAEIPHQLAYYAGWPRSFSALTPMRQVFEARGDIATDEAAVDTPDSISIVRADGETFEAAAETFTGSVTVGPSFEAPGDARVSGALVTFQPGARTAWHSHPLGQTLYITRGCALIQSEGQDVLTAGPGDIVQIPPEDRHWHGATSDQGMAHLAFLESLDGVGTTWMEHVAHDQIPQSSGC